MSGNDLINVLVSIVIGLAIAHLLGGVGRIMRAPKVTYSLLHSAWVLFLLLECVSYWVSSALTRSASGWTYPSVLRAFFTSALLYLSCWLLLPDETPKEAIDLVGFYNTNRKKFLGVFVIYTMMISINLTVDSRSATGSWTGWLSVLAACIAWIWPARAAQILAVVILFAVQTAYEVQYTWRFS